MAPPTGTLRVGRYFAALLAIIAILYAIVFWPGARHTPKLGIDLAGGTEVIFTAKTVHGGTPSSSSMSQAKTIMTDRVNGTGVTEATVVIQGSNQLVVSIPGKQDEQVSKLGAAAVLNMRGLVAPGAFTSCVPIGSKAPSSKPTSSTSSTPANSKPTGSTTPTSSSSHSGADAAHALIGKASPSTTPKTTPANSASKTPTSTATSTKTPTPTSTATTTPTAAPCTVDPIAEVAKAGKFTVPLNDVDYNKLSASNQQLVQAALANFNCASGQTEPDIATKYFVACDSSGIAYLLGPVVVAGRQISTASAQAPNAAGSGGSLAWSVNLTLGDTGLKKWASYTHDHNFGSSSTNQINAYQCSFASARCANYVGFTLDGKVISIPQNESTINTNPTQITGSFTASTARTLANQLKYGALPLSFKLESAQPVSATLGSSQLKAGLLAGGIGLILVVLYSLIYYRALGLVTIASLLVSGALTYGSLVMLATQIDFTLSLAGIAGFIVAVGITADSFVVFFERMKDEVHEGRSARVAIPRAWVRARRTILSADTVSFLAAAILYYFAAGDVRGFAFTLGLSTILDLVVVFLFTHPLISFLSRFQAFGSARFTGLDAVRGGPAVSDSSTAVARTRTKPARSTSAKPAPATTSAAVLDDEDDADSPVGDVDDTDATVEAQAEAEATDEAGSEEPRRTTPEPGSAAERAAARRARMREQGNTEKGES